MEPNQTYKLLHSKENHKQNEKTDCGLGENICKQYDWQGLNFQNMQTVHTAQLQKTPKQPNPKNGQKRRNLKQKQTNKKNGQKT